MLNDFKNLILYLTRRETVFYPPFKVVIGLFSGVYASVLRFIHEFRWSSLFNPGNFSAVVASINFAQPLDFCSAGALAILYAKLKNRSISGKVFFWRFIHALEDLMR